MEAGLKVAGDFHSSTVAAGGHGRCCMKPWCLVEPRFAAGDLPRTSLRGLENALHEVVFGAGAGGQLCATVGAA